GDLRGKKFGVWGLAFKPNTDDIREAPALVIINHLLKSGSQVKVFDPVAMDHVRQYFEDKVDYGTDAYDVLPGADALLIVTEWNEFRQADLEQVKKGLKNPVIFDGRNIFKPEKMKKLGFVYHSIGRS